MLRPKICLNWLGNRHWIIFCFLSLSLNSFIYGQKNDAPTLDALEAGKPLERTIAAKEIQKFQITIPENQYAFITVEQRGADVALLIIDPNNERVVRRDMISKTEGREEIGFLASTAGAYRLEIEAKVNSLENAKYTVTLAEVRPPTTKETNLEQARQLHNQSLKLWQAGKFAEAMPVAKRALEIRQKELGENNLDVALSIANVALFYNEIGDYKKGVELLEQSLQIRENILGLDHLDLTATLNNLGEMNRILGNFEKSETYLRRSLAIREKNLPPTSPQIAITLSNLAALYLERGDANKSLELELRATDIWEKALGPDDPFVARGLSGIGNSYSEKGDFKSAESPYIRALEILQKKFGAEHPRVADAMGNLAQLYTKQGDYAKAEPLFQQALVVMEKTFGKEHRNYALALYWLAVLYTDTGEYQKAEPLYRQAIEITEKSFGAQHPFVVMYLDELARNYQAKGETAKAIETLTEAHQIKEKIIRLVLATNSERQKVSYLKRLFYETNLYISAHQKYAPENPSALELALTTIFERKGRVSDAMASDFAALRNRFNKDDQLLLDKLREVTAQLAKKILDESPGAKPSEYQKQLAELEQEKERLEIEIGRRSSEFRSQIQPVSIDSIRAAIPENAALVEFSVYYPYDPKLIEDKAYAEPRYVVYIVRRTGKIEWKDLGETKNINEAIESFRKALSNPESKDVKLLARKIDEKIMQPIRALTGSATQLLISPDGALNLVPFEAFVDEKNAYLVENFSFTYLTGGRDLLRMQVPRENKNKSLIVANPSFGSPIQTETVARNNPVQRRSITIGRSLSETYFAPLGGTIQEASSIQKLFPDAAFLSGVQATETALKQTIAPKILHIATHGFFLEDVEDISKNKAANRGEAVKTETENPLLRSGLALAGANRREGRVDDGILTALEASSLNLWGTKLVVLSACDTGLGEVKNGEGVYGLRRAFTLAGTESLVMSLWAVSDAATRELMTDYYKNLKQGIGRGESLRRVKLEMLKKENRQHPFYWAAFIQSGEWANLDGRNK